MSRQGALQVALGFTNATEIVRRQWMSRVVLLRATQPLRSLCMIACLQRREGQQVQRFDIAGIDLERMMGRALHLACPARLQ